MDSCEHACGGGSVSRTVTAPPWQTGTERTLRGTRAAGASRSVLLALSTCLRCNGNSALGGSGAVEVRGSGGFRRPGDVVPDREPSRHFGAIVVSGEPMAAGPEMRG